MIGNFCDDPLLEISVCDKIISLSQTKKCTFSLELGNLSHTPNSKGKANKLASGQRHKSVTDYHMISQLR